MGSVQAEERPRLGRQQAIGVESRLGGGRQSFATRVRPEFGGGSDRVPEKWYVAELMNQLIQLFK